MKDFVVGAQIYSVRTLAQSAQGLKDTLIKLKAMGYNTCQLSGQSREIPDEVVRDILQETGMKCVVTHNSIDDFDNALDELIKRHKTWDCAYAGLGAMPAQYRESLDTFKEFALHANEIAEKLYDNGINFVYHNHAFEFQKINGVTGMDVLFDNFGPHTQFELDSFWVQAGGANPVEWFYKVNGRMEVAHFKDMMGAKDGGVPCTMVPIGSGNLDWPALKRACEETGVKYAEIEQDNAVEKEHPLGELCSSINYLKSIGCIF
ncbi:MAG: sugar phosphate isomerase/epimerase [Clostridia bacterium]|nr:sugar phosphate isomerase/epimerase [Clostridia bacterium]